MSEIESKVKAIIVDKLGVDEAEVKPEASFTNDLGADSLDTVELIMEFEKEFGISIPDDKADVVLYAAQAPQHVQIAEVLVLATHQANGFTISRNPDRKDSLS